jgi:hypothetical protein
MRHRPSRRSSRSGGASSASCATWKRARSCRSIGRYHRRSWSRIFQLHNRHGRALYRQLSSAPGRRWGMGLLVAHLLAVMRATLRFCSGSRAGRGTQCPGSPRPPNLALGSPTAPGDAQWRRLRSAPWPVIWDSRCRVLLRLHTEGHRLWSGSRSGARASTRDSYLWDNPAVACAGVLQVHGDGRSRARRLIESRLPLRGAAQRRATTKPCAEVLMGGMTRSPARTGFIPMLVS